MSTFIDLLHRAMRRRYRRAGFSSRLLECGRFTLNYYECHRSDSAKTIMLVHGLGTSSSTWTHVLPKLSTTCNVIALDLPGFGLSTVNSGAGFARFHELYDALVEFIRQKSARPILLLGHSLGGWIAAKVAVNHPEMVAHLILVNNAGIFCEDTARQGSAFQVESIGDLRSLLNLIWFRYPWYFRPFYPAVLNDLRRRHVAEFVRSIQAKDFLNDELRKLAVRVSIIWGRRDNLISMKSVEIMERSIPHTTVHLLDKCGHVPQLERPKEFLNVVQRILEQQESKRQAPRPSSAPPRT